MGSGGHWDYRTRAFPETRTLLRRVRLEGGIEVKERDPEASRGVISTRVSD